jgi:hypothetical protein
VLNTIGFVCHQRQDNWPDAPAPARLVAAKFRNAGRRRKRSEDGSVLETSNPLRYRFVSIVSED